MNKAGAELSINTIVILILSLITLVVILIFFQIATGKTIFPELIEKLKFAFGFANQSRQALPTP
jgi:hypothetical protein